jgi:hypothetical protein
VPARSPSAGAFPASLKRTPRGWRAFDGVLDVAVPEIILNELRIRALVGEAKLQAWRSMCGWARMRSLNPERVEAAVNSYRID